MLNRRSILSLLAGACALPYVKPAAAKPAASHVLGKGTISIGLPVDKGFPIGTVLEFRQIGNIESFTILPAPTRTVHLPNRRSADHARRLLEHFGERDKNGVAVFRDGAGEWRIRELD